MLLLKGLFSFFAGNQLRLNHYICTASFLHELIQCVYSDSLLRIILTTIIAFVCLLSSIHELIWYVHLDGVFEEKICHNNYIWMDSFLHELIQYVYSYVSFEKNFHHNNHIWRVSFLHELIHYDNLVFRLPLRKKPTSQWLHLNDFVPLWTDSVCLLKTSLRGKHASRKFHLKWLLSFMNCFNMPIQISFLKKTCITSITFEKILSCMNCCLFISLFWKKKQTWITNLTFKKLLSCMTQYYTLSFGNEKTCITNVSFKGFFQTWTDLHDMCLKNMHYNCYIWILEISDYVFVFVLDSDGSHFIPFWKKKISKKGYIIHIAKINQL